MGGRKLHSEGQQWHNGAPYPKKGRNTDSQLDVTVVNDPLLRKCSVHISRYWGRRVGITWSSYCRLRINGLKTTRTVFSLVVFSQYYPSRRTGPNDYCPSTKIIPHSNIPLRKTVDPRVLMSLQNTESKRLLFLSSSSLSPVATSSQHILPPGCCVDDDDALVLRNFSVWQGNKNTKIDVPLSHPSESRIFLLCAIRLKLEVPSWPLSRSFFRSL